MVCKYMCVSLSVVDGDAEDEKGAAAARTVR